MNRFVKSPVSLLVLSEGNQNNISYRWTSLAEDLSVKGELHETRFPSVPPNLVISRKSPAIFAPSVFFFIHTTNTVTLWNIKRTHRRIITKGGDTYRFHNFAPCVAVSIVIFMAQRYTSTIYGYRATLEGRMNVWYTIWMIRVQLYERAVDKGREPVATIIIVRFDGRSCVLRDYVARKAIPRKSISRRRDIKARS